MSVLQIDLDGGRSAFKCGEALTGRVSWRMDENPTSASLRLFWYTRGKGTEDVEIVDSVVFTHPQQSDRREFKLRLPREPYSFSGKLISLIWALELIVEPGLNVERRELVMSPTGQEVLLNREGV